MIHLHSGKFCKIWTLAIQLMQLVACLGLFNKHILCQVSASKFEPNSNAWSTQIKFQPEEAIAKPIPFVTPIGQTVSEVQIESNGETSEHKIVALRQAEKALAENIALHNKLVKLLEKAKNRQVKSGSSSVDYERGGSLVTQEISLPAPAVSHLDVGRVAPIVSDSYRSSSLYNSAGLKPPPNSVRYRASELINSRTNLDKHLNQNKADHLGRFVDDEDEDELDNYDHDDPLYSVGEGQKFHLTSTNRHQHHLDFDEPLMAPISTSASGNRRLRQLANHHRQRLERQRDQQTLYRDGELGRYEPTVATSGSGLNNRYSEFDHVLSASPSHQVVHVHESSKGKGKYLWPIVGGGLTMLMGFLIISNMLLSIPLLAIGASSLFSQQGSFHSQQLVPVYNLSQLVSTRAPNGRRKRRRRRSLPKTTDDNVAAKLGSKDTEHADQALVTSTKDANVNLDPNRHLLEAKIERLIDSIVAHAGRGSPRFFGALGLSRKQVLKAAYCRQAIKIK